MKRTDPSPSAKLAPWEWYAKNARLQGWSPYSPGVPQHPVVSAALAPYGLPNSRLSDPTEDWLYEAYVYAQKVARVEVVCDVYSPIMSVLDRPSVASAKV